MSIITIDVIDQALMITNAPMISAGDIKTDHVKFTFDSVWTGYGKTAVFYRDDNKENIYEVALDQNNEAVIPHEVTAEDGKIWIGVVGVKSNGQTLTSEVIWYEIVDGVYTRAMSSRSAEASIYARILEVIEEMKATVGSPLVASTAEEMIDQTKIYVYVGSETGYTSGNWYYWNGSEWASGGIYNSTAFETDDTLSVDGMAADAGAVGNAIFAGRDREENTPHVMTRFSDVENAESFDDIPNWSICSLLGSKFKALQPNFPDASEISDNGTYYLEKRLIGSITMCLLYRSPRNTVWAGYTSVSDASIVNWNKIVSPTDATVSKAGIPADAKAVADIIYEERDKTKNTPHILTRYTGAANAETFADIPDWSICSLLGSKFKALQPDFPDAKEIGDNGSYYLEKRLLGTVTMCLLYRSPRTKVWAGYTSSSAPTVVNWNKIVSPISEIKILCFTNSFGYSDLGYLPAILREFGVNVTFAMLYKSGARISQHISNFDNNIVYDEYSECNGERWTNTKESVTAKEALEYYDWDYIILQQPTVVELDFDNVEAFADRIMAYVDYPFAFLYNMPHVWGANDPRIPTATYPDTSIPIPGETNEEISDNQFLLGAKYAHDLIYGDASINRKGNVILDVLPCGTAIQNARQLSVFKEIGTRGYLCVDDTSHLHNGIGPLIAGYAAALKICELIGAKQKVFASQLNPTDAWLASYNIYTKTIHGSSEGVTDANKLLAAKCALQAYKNPFVITQVITQIE